MNEVIALPSQGGPPLNRVPWEERFEDHNNKIEEYLQNCLFRGCSEEATLRDRAWILNSIFRRLVIGDSGHSAEQTQVLIWDLLNKILGSYYLSLLISSLLNDNVAPATRRKYLNCLRDFADYVIAKPHLPGGRGLSIVEKYGPISTPFTKYDLPIHAADRPQRNRYAISTGLCEDVFEFLRTEYVPNHPLPHVGARDYTALVIQAEVGARNSELVAIRCEGERSDIDEVKGRVRLFGKAKAFSGKRLRWVPLTPLAAEVLDAFQRVFKPMFPQTTYSDYLFLNEDGSRMTKYWYWKTFRKIVRLARDYGIELPEDLRPHDLRRSFATNELERNPLAYRKVLKHLGHSYPSSAAPYVIATDMDVEEGQTDLMDIYIDPYINKRRKK